VAATFQRFLECGILARGFLRVVCQDCKHEILVPWSCKTGICPSCGQRRSHEFAEFVNQVVLEAVAYRHVVFTIPKVLRRIFVLDRRLLRELSQCAWKTLRRGLQTALGNPAVLPGAVIAVATAGDLLNSHVHLHCIVAHGAWRDNGVAAAFETWPSVLTSERLEELFRRYVLRLLSRRGRLADHTVERLLGWSPSGFSVFLGEPIEPTAEQSRLRLARYLVKPPIALERLAYHPATCTVTYSSVKRGHTRTLTALDFMAELSVHIPHRREQTTRYYGRCSNRLRGARRSQESVEAGTGGEAKSTSRSAFRLAWARLLQRVWNVDIKTCGACGGAMKIISAIVEIAVADRILQHLGMLDLPRGPTPHQCEPWRQAALPWYDAEPSATADDSAVTVTADPPGPPVEDSIADPDYDWPVDPPFEED
jgi:hypothetical protein